MHHFGSGICSHTLFNTGAIFNVTVPDNHQVGLPRRGPEYLCAEARHIKARGRRSDHLNGAARQPERQRPDRALPRPIKHVVHGSDHEVLFEALVEHTHWRILP